VGVEPNGRVSTIRTITGDTVVAGYDAEVRVGTLEQIPIRMHLISLPRQRWLLEQPFLILCYHAWNGDRDLNIECRYAIRQLARIKYLFLSHSGGDGGELSL
jgi:hypothetical protein